MPYLTAVPVLFAKKPDTFEPALITGHNSECATKILHEKYGKLQHKAVPGARAPRPHGVCYGNLALEYG
jgi:hypothetical protein